MRVLRLLKLYRHSGVMRVFVHAFLLSRKHLMGMFLIVFILVYFGAVGIREIERDDQPDVFGSLFNSIWWTIVTLMSVGYGRSSSNSDWKRICPGGYGILLGIDCSIYWDCGEQCVYTGTGNQRRER